MAVTINELIAKKEMIDKKKKQLYDLETSVGTITVKIPSGALVSEAIDMPKAVEGNKHLIYESVVAPDLKSHELHKAFGVVEPIDVVSAIFPVGEVNAIAGKLLDIGGYNRKITATLHEEIKN